MIIKSNNEQRITNLEKENKRLIELVKSLSERIENLSILFFNLKDEVNKNNKSHP